MTRIFVRPVTLCVALAAALLAVTVPAGAQEAATGGGDEGAAASEDGPRRFGSFVHVEQADGTRLLVVPDRDATLDRGARLFFRCSDGGREVFVAVTEGEGRLGNARDGAGGRYRFGSLPWSDMVTWGANESGTAAFMPPRLTEAFAERARASDRVEIQIVNPAGVRHRYVFPMDGFAEGVERMACFEEEE